MYPAPIEEYHAPTSLEGALELLSRHGGSAKILAGGQSLMPHMKARLVAPRILVDINRIAGLDSSRDAGGALEIGALVRLFQAADDARLRRDYGALAEAAAAIGDRQVRNRGTLVGSIAFAANYGDVAPAAAVLDASVVIARSGTTRTQPIAEFVKGVAAVDLAAGEMVTALRLPAPAPRSGSAYVKFGRVYQDRAAIGVAVWLAVDAGGRCHGARIAIGGLPAHPFVRVDGAEALLAGKTADGALAAAAGAAAAATVVTQSDELASAAYRTQLILTGVPRALELARERAAR